MENTTTEIKREAVIPTGFKTAKTWTALFIADCKAYTIESTLPPSSSLLSRLDDFADLIREFWGITGNLKITGYDSDGSYLKLSGEMDSDYGTVKFSTPKMTFADDKLCDLAETDPDVRKENSGLLFNEEKRMLWKLEDEVINFIMGERGDEETPDLPFNEEEEDLLTEEN
jgi:hypothetical protein